MASLVVDSSVAIKWFVPEPFAAEAATILAAYQAGTLTLLAPDLIFAELGNILWKKQTLQGLAAAAADAARIIGDVGNLGLSTTPSVELLFDAYRLAVAHRRTVYDALYLALGLRENCAVVTADERLVNAVGAALPNVSWLGTYALPPTNTGT